MDADTINNLLLFSITVLSAGLTALWFGLTLWTWQDMRARSRDPLAQVAASVVVFVLPGFGIIVYLLLRPRETLADAYERSLEEEALLQEIEERPACPGCGRAVKKDWQVCPYCHTRLKKACLNCGYRLELAWNICPSCTTAQVGYDESAEPLPQRAAKSRSVMQQLQQERQQQERQQQEPAPPHGDDRSPYAYDPDEDLRFVDE